MDRYENQLKRFHDEWLGLARLYQLRKMNDKIGPGLTVSQFYALGLLAENDGSMKMSEFGKQLNLSFAGVNRMMVGLEKKTFVKKAVSKTDARVQIVTLTSIGKKNFQKMQNSFFENAKVTLDKIEARDREALIQGIRAMKNSLPDWRASLQTTTFRKKYAMRSSR